MSLQLIRGVFFGQTEGNDLKDAGLLMTLTNAAVQTVLVPFYSVIFILSKFWPLLVPGCCKRRAGARVGAEKEDVEGADKEDNTENK